MGLYEEFDSVKPSSRPDYLGTGEHLLEVERIKENQGLTGHFFIAELRVVESDNPTHKVGQTRAWVVRLEGKAKASALADIKSFLAACHGFDPSSVEAQTEITGKVFKLAISEENPMEGNLVRASSREKPTKNGGIFTVHDWSPADESEKAA